MTDRDQPVDPRHEEAFARALHAEAEGVRPVGDGLVRIRARVERRRRRTRWLAPTATVATVAATVTAVVGSGLLSGPSRSTTASSLPPLTLTSTTKAIPAAARTAAPTQPAAAPTTAPAAQTAAPVPVASAVASVAVANLRCAFALCPVTPAVATTATVVAPPAAVSPPTTVASAALPTVNAHVLSSAPIWPAADATTGWVSPVDTAEQFVTSLHLPTGNLSATGLVPAGALTADIAVSDTGAGSTAQVVLGVVHLSRATPTAFWRVLSMSNPDLTITTPVGGATVGSPLQVGFTLTGGTVDTMAAAAWTSGGGVLTAPTALPSAADTASGTVVLTPRATAGGPGYVVLADEPAGTVASVSRIAVTPVTFPATTTAVTGPTYVAVVGGRIGLYDAASGNLIHPLAPAAGGVTEVQVSDDEKWVYYLQGAGCGAAVMRTPLDGTGTPTVVPTTGGSITSFDIAGPDAGILAYVSASCTGADQTLVSSTGASVRISQSLPPDARTVAVSSDGTKLASYVRMGMAGTVELFAVPTAHSLADATHPAGCSDNCLAAAYAPDGDLVYVVAVQQQLSVVLSHDGTDSQLFSVSSPGTSSVTLDVDATGNQVLLTDGIGHGWSWTGSGPAKALPGAVTDASW